MTTLTDTDLYLRGVETLVASWEEYARGSRGAAVMRSPGVAIAVFPNEPERAVYNDAVLEGDLAAAERVDAVNAMEAAYAASGVTHFAAWVHESDEATRFDLERRGYTLAESTRAMGMALEDIRLPRPDIELGPPDWYEYLRIVGVPPNFLSGANPAEYRILVARLDGENVAAAMAFDHCGDCGIYNVGTLEHARRRGLGTVLTALHLHDALARGCQTRACSRRRWPSACTPPSASVISAECSNTCRRSRYRPRGNEIFSGAMSGRPTSSSIWRDAAGRARRECQAVADWQPARALRGLRALRAGAAADVRRRHGRAGRGPRADRAARRAIPRRRAQQRCAERLQRGRPVPELLAALAEAPEGEPFELEVELGAPWGEVARWLNPLVLRALRCE